MNCRGCGALVREGARFCESCGTALERKCEACGAAASAKALFCGMCGAGLGAAPGATPVPAPAAPRPAAPEAERRQLTVLFADVVGATTLSGRLDPEALRALLRDYQAVCVECVERYGGNIHQYAGDGVLAYFGYPEAHDNDAERAVLAGLDIAAGVARLSAAMRERGDPEVSVRIGVHTGMVVVGEMGAGTAREVHAIGETPNVASRVQGEAQPDSVCISAATERLLGRRFRTRSMGSRTLKGVAREVELFSVDPAPATAPEAAVRDLPIIGRDRELAHLSERWAQACRGEGQAVLVSGEGGIGKSRLLAAFREQAGGAKVPWRNVYCSPFYRNSALHPLIDLIERAVNKAGAKSGAGPGEDRGAVLRRSLEAAGLGDDMTFALMAALVGLEGAHEAALGGLAPDQRKRRTVDALIAWLSADAQAAPMVLVVEDLHWVDASTQDLLGTLLERVARMPILVVLTYRPEFVPAWAMHGQVSTLPLGRLTAGQSDEVARAIIGATTLPAHIVEQLIRRTDGVPLYVEELTKAMVDARAVPGAGAAPPLEVPASLRDSLTARLDRLGEAKTVAQLASVLGREFDYAILHAICALPPAVLEHKLAALNSAGIIHQHGIPPRSHYVFKHALIQEAAYDTLLKATRAQYHQRAAEAYARDFPELAQSRPELLAHHYSRAQLPAQAVACWQRAGEVAVLHSGYSEATGHLGSALEQLALLPETHERMATELALRVKIGPALIAHKGMGSAEASENYVRACRLAQIVGDSPEGFMALWGDWINTSSAGRTREAVQRSEDLVALSRRLGSEEFVLQAHHSRWTNFFGLGDARVCRADTLVGLRLYDRERHRHHRHVYGGHDPGVCACGVGANAAWLTGYGDEALRLAGDAVSLSRSLEHPFSHALGLWWSSMGTYATRSYALAQERAEELLKVSDAHGFRQWRSPALLVAGACRTFRGEAEFGLKLLEEGMAELRHGLPTWLGWSAALAAEVHVHCGNPARARELLGETAGHAGRADAPLFRPEVERLQAEVLLQVGQLDVAEAIVRIEGAAALARQQGAVALEWRASMSLARLQAAQGREAEARDLLRGKYAAFTEGFSLPDLVEGKALMDSLG